MLFGQHVIGNLFERISDWRSWLLNGVLVGFVIMIASLIIPLVHYVTAPLSPFVAGFIGSGIANIDQNGIVKFGALTALLMVIPALVVSLLKFVIGVDEIFNIPTTWVMIALLIFVPYTWFGATVGAMGGYYVRRNQK
tara:strand:- start:94 stop:507 length:414 start_codon:yes stop_codon:yes gene_type:complete